MTAAPAPYDRHQAFEDVVERHKRRVTLAAYRITRNLHDAQDVAQHVFMQMYQRSPTFPNQRSIERWLYVVTRNQALHVSRRRTLDAAALMLTYDRAPQRALEDTIVSHERAHEVRALIARLPTADRNVIELRYLTLMSTTEIADHFNLPTSRVKRDVRRAKWRLRNAILRHGLEVDV